MAAITASLLVGIGLFFYGMRIVGNELKHLSGRRVRMMFAQLTKNRFIAILGGFFSGTITQSTSNASLIITNLVVSRILSVRDAIPVIAASNIGTCLLVFLTAVNIKLAVLYLLGVTAILYSLNRNFRERAVTGVILGVGVLLFGFNLFVGEAKSLFNTAEVKDFLGFLQGGGINYVLVFIIGAVLRFATQSTSTVSVIAISLCQTGILGFDQALLMVFGAPFGSVITLLLASKGFKGAAKQVTYFQMLFETAGTIIMTLLLAAELVFNVPLIKAFIGLLSENIAGQIAFALLIMRVIPFIISLLLIPKIVELLKVIIPPGDEETLMTPVYIYDGAIEDPGTAMSLAESEQSRLIERFPLMVENVRTEHDTDDFNEYGVLHEANLKLKCEIDDFIAELFNNNLDRDASERLVRLQNAQNFITLIEDNIYNLIKEIDSSAASKGVRELMNKLIESLHAVLSINTDMCREPSKLLVKSVMNMTSDKEDLMEIIRKPFLTENSEFSNEDRIKVLNITNLYQRIIWLINRYAALYVKV